MENGELRKEERRALMSAAVLSVAQYADENPLYIDTYVGADATAVFIGAEDVQDLPDAAERKIAITEFRTHYRATEKIILEESGVHAINKHFRIISRSRPASLIINRIKELEREQKKI